MLQSRDSEQRFEHITQAIGQASRAAGAGVSPNLRDCIDKLDRQSDQARAVLQSRDEGRIGDCIDGLESLGDEAERVMRSDPQASTQVQANVARVRDELSDLKHQRH
jgi:hypothetical protein